MTSSYDEGRRESRDTIYKHFQPRIFINLLHKSYEHISENAVYATIITRQGAIITIIIRHGMTS